MSIISFVVFFLVSWPPKTQKHMFHLSKQMIFENSPFAIFHVFELQNGTVLAPKSTPKSLKIDLGSESGNRLLFYSEKVPKMTPTGLHFGTFLVLRALHRLALATFLLTCRPLGAQSAPQAPRGSKNGALWVPKVPPRQPQGFKNYPLGVQK